MPRSLPSTLSTHPVKAFFVDMLTRDIDLDDAILDLLDNCVDGAVRTLGKRKLSGRRPYEGFHAQLKLTGSSFSIRDNCGGIPLERQEYAFEMGRRPGGRDLKLPTVGTYGIGMKRAVFKIGRDVRVHTKNGGVQYTARFPPQWFEAPSDWTIKVSYGRTPLDDDGTIVEVGNLLSSVATQFRSDAFLKRLREKIATHYAFILDKGFSVSLNEKEVEPRPIRLGFSKQGRGAVRPFIFTRKGKVDVFLAVGFASPIPSVDEAMSSSGELPRGRFSAADAGWTVVCNDRTVLYCDKSSLTGWGEAGVPRYHNQFIAVSGIVEFRSDDASLLPTTTTKRGIDASSTLYLEVKEKMRQGMKLFTDYTNRWKAADVAAEGKRLIERAELMDFHELKSAAASLKLTEARRASGKQYKPQLPRPTSKASDQAQIMFSRSRSDVEQVGAYLLGDSDASPATVGAECFDVILKESQE